MPFVVNSSPGAGLRFEPGQTFTDAKAALNGASMLALRGMRLIRIRDLDTGEVFDDKALREKLDRDARDLAEQAAARRTAATE
ncbi:MAG: hypothetical protein JNM59_06430 [Hyphomonadaceae bacterium]|nr:hypothetical protein [Hyphomonadaceae bacterium]